MYNKELRKELLANGKAKEYFKKRKKYYNERATEDEYLGKDNHIHAGLRDKVTNEWITRKPSDYEYFNCESKEELETLERIRNSVRQQVKRIKLHLSFLLKQYDYSIYFLTLTFTDKALEETAEETRRKTIVRLLKEISEDFIANIDYGKDTEREHYHAIIAVKKEEDSHIIRVKNEKGKSHLQWEKLADLYKYGNYNIKKVWLSSVSIAKLTRYINKLSLHTTKPLRSIITPRGTRFQEYKKDAFFSIDREIHENIYAAREIQDIEEGDIDTIAALTELFKGDFEIEEETQK